MTAPKAAKMGADDFRAAGLTEDDGFDKLPRGEVAYQLERHGDEFLLRWPAHKVECTLTGLREHSDGVSAELTILHAGTELHWGRLGLASTQTRQGVVRKVMEILPDLPWRTIVEVACRAPVRALREAAVTVALHGRLAAGPRHLLAPLMPLHQISVGFGDGGAGKGNLAVAFGLAVSQGATLPPGLHAAARCPILYLDWESDQEDLDDRVARVARGLGLTAVTDFHYRRMYRPLAEETPALRAEVSRLKAGLLIVDSLAPACGPEPEGADAAIRTHNAIRSLGPLTCWCLAHVTKAAATQRGPATPFGSVFVKNLARSVWEIRRSDDEDSDDLRVGLYHRKVNGGRLLAPLALRFHFGDAAITLHGADLAEAPDLLIGTSLSRQVLVALRGGAKKGGHLAEELGQKPDTIGRVLRRLGKGGHVVRLSEEHGGRGQEILWGLQASKADT